MNRVGTAQLADEVSSFECRGVDISIAGRTLVDNLEHSFAPGTITAVLGQNGAGKTTTLHTLAGIRSPGAGFISLYGKKLADWERRKLAQTLGLLMQGYEFAFPSNVLAAVLVGRHPHIGLLRWEDDHDLAVARAALASVGMEGLEDRDILTLSGGERRRLAIATLLAQQTDIVLLDEPVSSLDPRFQILIMRVLRQLAQGGRTVILSLHDANLAHAYCDHALLLLGDGRWQAGSCEQVVNAESLTRLFDTSFRTITAEGLPYFFPR